MAVALTGSNRAASEEAVIHPQSTGPDGAERLAEAWAMPRRGVFTEPNNTWIGRLYIGTAFVFFAGAGVLALLMRIQLAVPGNSFLDSSTYNQLFTMHGTVMMFLFGVPIGEAFAMLLLPNMVGARDMPFPWLSAFGYWCYAIGGVPPLGHATPAPVLIDRHLLEHEVVWAAAGLPDAVFAVHPRRLAGAAGAREADLAAG